MTIENIFESYSGLFYSRAMAEYAAAELRAEGRETKIDESNLHVGQWTVHATSLPEDTKPKLPEVIEDVAPIEGAPAELETTDRTDLSLHTYRTKTEAEHAAMKLQMEGRQTKILPSQLHKNQFVLYSIKLPSDDK